VPRNANDPQARNWTEAARQTTGAANVWSMMSVDAERDLVFLPTASASPDFYGGERPGDNRYANSVVALRGATGKPVWHFQIVHHDAWGFTFFDRMFCRNWLERSRTDHFYAPPSPEGTASYPGMAVNNWGGGAVNGQDLLIVPINRAIIVRSLIPVADVDPEALQHPMAGLPGRLDGTDYAQQFQPMLSPLFSPCNRPPWGELAGTGPAQRQNSLAPHAGRARQADAGADPVAVGHAERRRADRHGRRARVYRRDDG